jgi:hypothetical protein
VLKGLNQETDPGAIAGRAKCDGRIIGTFMKADLKGPDCETSNDAGPILNFEELVRRAGWAQLCVMRDPDIIGICVPPPLTLTADCARGCNGGTNQGMQCLVDLDCPSAACVSGFPPLVAVGICIP